MQKKKKLARSHTFRDKYSSNKQVARVLLLISYLPRVSTLLFFEESCTKCILRDLPCVARFLFSNQERPGAACVFFLKKVLVYSSSV